MGIMGNPEAWFWTMAIVTILIYICGVVVDIASERREMNRRKRIMENQ